MLRQTPVDLRAAASPHLLERGCVNIIGVGALKREAGPRWPRIRDAVYARAEALLRQKLGPTDFFARIDDDSYLITMPSSNSEDVNVVCLRITHDLCTSFLGQCDLSHVEVSNASSAGEAGLLLRPLPVERIVSLAEKAGIREFNLVPYRQTSRPVASSFRSDEESTDVSRSAFQPSVIVEHHYVPVWSAAKEAVTTYICEPKAIHSAQVPSRPLTLAQLSPKERIQLELSCLRAGAAHLIEHIQDGIRFLLGISVSFDVIGSPAGRMEFLSACKELSSECRQYIGFTLTDVPRGVVHARLNDLVNVLRPFAHSVWATIAPDSRDYAAYEGLGLRAIGFDLGNMRDERQFASQNAVHLGKFAKSMKLATFAYGIHNIATLQAAYQSNIQFLSGPAVAMPRTQSLGIYRITWDQVLAHDELSA